MAWLAWCRAEAGEERRGKCLLLVLHLQFALRLGGSQGDGVIALKKEQSQLSPMESMTRMTDWVCSLGLGRRAREWVVQFLDVRVDWRVLSGLVERLHLNVVVELHVVHDL